MLSSTLLLLLGAALKCSGKEFVGTYVKRKQLFSPYEKFGLNVTSNQYGMPDILK
jgi:hypothetical protein